MFRLWITPYNDGMRWRRVGLVAGILVLAGGIGAATWGLLAYQQVTKIDRSNPKVVTDEYLRATLVRKDTAGADLYACDDQSGLSSIKALRADLDQREKTFGVSIVVSWGAYSGSGADLSTDLTIAALKNGTEESSSVERWKFTLQDNGGWRVCSAERVVVEPSATPTTAP